MKFVDEYRDAAAARKLADAIAQTATRPWTIMEVCGGQTHTIVKYGIDRVLLVFFAIGFETTAPPNAMAVWLARKRRLSNFSVVGHHWRSRHCHHVGPRGD
jgi:hydrogenase maturation factor